DRAQVTGGGWRSPARGAEHGRGCPDALSRPGWRVAMAATHQRSNDMADPLDVTASIDVDQPSQAPIYDYLLGGSLNFAADREAARVLMATVPDVPLVAQANRAFLRRAVGFLVDAGVRQFLDIGSGIPTRGNVHEIAHQVAPESRVVYV